MYSQVRRKNEPENENVHLELVDPDVVKLVQLHQMLHSWTQRLLNSKLLLVL